MAKTIVLTTIGTRGDVQPYVALGLGLMRAGYRVKLAAPENFENWVTGHGLEFARCGADSKAFVNDPEVKNFIDEKLIYQIRNARKIGLSFIKSITEDIYAATKDADAIIFHPKADFSIDVAEAKNIPAIMAGFQPLSPTAEFPILILPWPTLGPWLNRASYGVIYLSRILYNKYLNECRRDFLGLPPRPRITHPTSINNKRLPALYAFSRHIMPRPRDWPGHIHLTGYWFLDENPNWNMPDDLREFIKAEAPPIYVGFGSMPLKDPQGAARMFGEAIRALGLRAVMARGWADFMMDEATQAIPNMDPHDGSKGTGDIFFLDEAPHEHLFQHMSAVVHHGGAGTTAAGLRAGCPTLVCPFLVDQPFWGRRVEALGAGPEPLPAKTWNGENIRQSLLDLTTNDTYAGKAKEIADLLAAEDGVARAVEIVQEIVG